MDCVNFNDNIMKRLIIVLLALFVWHGVHICAYDFIGVVKEASYPSPILYHYYCNIISDENSEIPTCEITYSDKEEIDGVTVYNQKHEFGHIHIPSTVIYDGTEYTVIGIGDHAFQDLPDDLPQNQMLGTTVSVGNSVRYIGKEAFKNCKKLYQLYIRDVEEIGESAFENCIRLNFVEFPTDGNVKNKCHIASKAFHGCDRLSWFCVNSMPPSLFDIEEGAFDVIYGKIWCVVYTVEDDALLALYENSLEEPWTLFYDIYATNMRTPGPSGPLGVESIYEDKDENERKYDLQGRPLQGEPDGIYIYKGKKYIDRR